MITLKEAVEIPQEGLMVRTVAQIFPDKYFQIQEWEQDGKIYEKLGVRKAKKFLPNGDFLINMMRRFNYTPPTCISLQRPTISEARRYHGISKNYEAVHVLGMIPVGVAAVVGLETYDLGMTFVSAVGFLGNVYPIMIQRYNRARINRIISRDQRVGLPARP